MAIKTTGSPKSIADMVASIPNLKRGSELEKPTMPNPSKPSKPDDAQPLSSAALKISRKSKPYRIPVDLIDIYEGQAEDIVQVLIDHAVEQGWLQ